MVLSIVASALLLTTSGDTLLPKPFSAAGVTTVAAGTTTLPAPLPSPTADSRAATADTAHRSTDTIAIALSPTANRPDSADTSRVQPGVPYTIHRMMGPDGLNFERLERPPLNDDGSEIKRSVKLNEHERKMGLGWLVPGGIAGMIGTMVCMAAFGIQTGASTTAVIEPLALGGGILLFGGISISVGVHKLREHARWHERYHSGMLRPEPSPPAFTLCMHF